MVSLQAYTVIQNTIVIALITSQILGLILLGISRFLDKRADKGKIKNKNNLIEIFFHIGFDLVCFSFICFLFLFINKNIHIILN